MTDFTLSVTPNSSICNSTAITATILIVARDARGLAPVPTRFTGTTLPYGTVDAAAIVTDAQGRASTTFRPGNVYGPITITAYPVNNSDLVRQVTYTCPNAPVIN